MTTASGLLDRPAYFLHWGVVQISLANFIVIVAGIVIFVLALLLPFPSGRRAARIRQPSPRKEDQPSDQEPQP